MEHNAIIQKMCFFGGNLTHAEIAKMWLDLTNPHQRDFWGKFS
jgi:hypothetical protein